MASCLQDEGPSRIFSLTGGLSGGGTQRAGEYMAGSYGSAEAGFQGVYSVPPVWLIPNGPA